MSGTVFGVISAASAGNPSGLALGAPGADPLDHAGLIRFVAETGARLNAHGIARGDRVAILLPNGAATALANLCVLAVAASVPINPDYTSEELKTLLARTGATHILTSRELLTKVRAAVEDKSTPIVLLESSGQDRAGMFALDFGDLPARAVSGEPLLVAPEDIALVLHTSGTTSEPKIVPLTQANLVASMRNLSASLELAPTDICLSALPLFHIGALVDLLFGPLSAGGGVICLPSMAADGVLSALGEFRPTWFQAVPTMLQDILLQAPHDKIDSPLRFIRSVSSSLPPTLHAEIERRFDVPVIEIYGMTETSGLIASNPLPPGVRRTGSVGVPSGTEIRVVDIEGNPLPRGRRGEVVIAGPGTMKGYEQSSLPRSETFRGKWLRSGDEGYIDEDGYLFLTGRIKEIINRGGEKISPRQIDELVFELPGIAEAAACPIPHPSLGEEVGLAVVRRPDSSVSEREIIAHLGARLAPFKVPRRVHFLDALPRLPSGKISRRLVAEQISGPENQPHALRRAPEGPMETLLSGLWEKTLGISDISVDDNFFDLGGDSLKATSFVLELESRLKRELPAGILFDAPTIAEMAEALDHADIAAPNVRRSTATRVKGQILRRIAGWKGTRTTSDALLVGRNTLGELPPLFWGFNSQREFDQLGAHLDGDRPLYAMCTIDHRDKLKAARDAAELAGFYADEICGAQPDGPLLIGGFCAGGRLAFEIAKRLEAQSRKVALLCLHDRFVAEPYEGPMALFWSGTYGLLAPDLESAEQGWRKFYTGEISVYEAGCHHDNAYAQPHVQRLAREIETRLAEAVGQSLARETAPSQLRRLDLEFYRASVSARAPFLMMQGAAQTVVAAIRNDSALPWNAEDLAGIRIGARWRNLDFHAHVQLDAATQVPGPIAPGETATVEMTVNVPRRGLPMLLDIDLLELGVGWFQDRGGSPSRSLVLPLAARSRNSEANPAN